MFELCFDKYFDAKKHSSNAGFGFRGMLLDSIKNVLRKDLNSI